MRTLSVALDARSYPIHIGAGLLADPGLILPYLKTKRVAVITNTVVGPLYLAPSSPRCVNVGCGSPRSCSPMARLTRTG